MDDVVRNNDDNGGDDSDSDDGGDDSDSDDGRDDSDSSDDGSDDDLDSSDDGSDDDSDSDDDGSDDDSDSDDLDYLLKDPYSRRNTMDWCGEMYSDKNNNDVQPDEMNGSVYVCPKYRVWPTYTVWDAVRQDDREKVERLMADFMPIRGDISRPPSADTKLLKLYVNSIFRRYRDETIVDNAHKLEEESDLSEDEVSILYIHSTSCCNIYHTLNVTYVHNFLLLSQGW